MAQKKGIVAQSPSELLSARAALHVIALVALSLVSSERRERAYSTTSEFNCELDFFIRMRWKKKQKKKIKDLTN